MVDYKDKAVEYFSNTRVDVIALIPKNPDNKILEIGAGSGSTLVRIKELGLAAETVGIELMEMPQTLQNHPSIDKLYITDIEKNFPAIQENYFDVIIAGDVLEHLLDPWKMVEKITTLLKPGGLLICSLPNIREIATLWKVFIKGDFAYTKEGILDKTHLRFFCKKNIIALVTSPQLEFVKAHSNLHLQPNAGKRRFINKLSGRLFEQFLSRQYLTVSKKK
jgi:2-polyprenyl-3-methyl-5-hydroxy-6-metoxy-1,4-benzoquinol methylase